MNSDLVIPIPLTRSAGGDHLASLRVETRESPFSLEEWPMTDPVQDHHRACEAFSTAVGLADGRWGAPSPCTEWDARGVLEHVIGFHDELLLRPLEAKPERPKDDPQRRWAVTVEAISGALTRPDAMDDGRGSLLDVLATDVLVHTWDLSAAIGVEVILDPELCQIGLDRALAHQKQLEESGMFGPPIAVSEDADLQGRLLAVFGRDPGWRPGI
jgi:uncharacterized protein (TIGR03086 family)